MSDLSPPGRNPRTVPALFAREGVLERMEAALAEGVGVTLRGSPGVGKSAILRHIVGQAELRGDRVLSLTGSELGISVPLGAFLPLVDSTALLPSAGGEAESVELLRIAAIVREKASTAEILVIDDAHLLDPASAGLLHQLASSGMQTLLAVRSGEPVPAAIEALWAGGQVRTVELCPFSEPETATLVHSLLPGIVDKGLAQGIFAASGGNALFIRELVRAGIEQKVLVQRRGVWVLSGPLPVAGNLVAMLRSRLARADDEVRYATELTAVMGSLRLEWVLRLVSRECLERAEAAGLLRSDGSSRITLRLGHPLYREAALRDLSVLHRRRLHDDLARILDTETITEAERITLGRWSLELGHERPAAEWLALAGLVQGTDHALAERFLIAAAAGDGGIPARLALANLLTHHHRVDEAETIFESLALESLAPEQRCVLAATRAFLLAMPAQRPEESLAILDEAIREFGQLPGLVVTRSTALWRAGYVSEAIELALRVLSEQSVPIEIAAHASLTAGSAALYGLQRRALAEVQRRMSELVAGATDSLPEAPGAALLIETSNYAMLLGDLDRGKELTERGYLDALHRGDDGVRAQYALLHGWLCALAGDITGGLGYLQEAYAGHGVWIPTTLPWVRHLLIEILVANGQLDAARSVLSQLDAAPFAGLYTLDIALARAAVLAAGGEREAAAAVLREATPEAEARGSRLRANEAWYARLRYGDASAADGVIARYGREPGPQNAAVAEHAAAVRLDDPAALETAVRSLDKAGLLWFATEAQAQAVEAHRRRKDDRATAFAIERLSRLVARCSGFNSPLIRDQMSSALTFRESELARLAAEGLSDAEIAERLGISIRTVQTHLGRVYAKLGVRGRAELSLSLDGVVG